MKRTRITAIILITVITALGTVGVVGTVTAQGTDFSDASSIKEGNITGNVGESTSDFYRFTVGETAAIDITTLSTSNGGVDFTLYDEGRDSLASGSSSGIFADERIVRKAPATGTYYIEVSGIDTTSSGTDYTLGLDIVSPSKNDDYAPNNEFESAAAVNEGTISGTAWGEESDFYRFTADTTDAIDAEITADSGDVDFTVYDESRDSIASGGTFGAFADERIVRKAPTDGTYYIEVTGYDAEDHLSDYTVDLDIVSPSENDDYAPNDDFDSAAMINERFVSGTAWGEESDFYRFTANSTDAIEVEVTDVSGGDVDFAVYDESRDSIASGGTFGVFADERIVRKAPTDGTYYIEVTGYDAEDHSAEYTVERNLISPSENDEFAPNNDFRSAAPISQEFTNAKIWGGESDFYRVSLNRSEKLDLEVTPQTADLELILYGEDREQLASDGNVRSGDSGSVSIQASEAGTYYAEITGSDAGTTTEYTLQSNQTGVSSDNDSGDSTEPSEDDDKDLNNQTAIQESEITSDGSIVTINLADDVASAAVEGLPDGASVSELSGVGQPQPGGAIWNSPSGDTVSFVLTPPENVPVGDSFTFDVYDGRTTTTVAVDVVRQTSVLQEETVSLGGSDVTLNVSENAESVAVQGLPDGASVSELSDGGQSQPGGAIWTSPSSDTVSFTLTPPSSVGVGETITFDVFDGDTTTAVSLDVTEGVPVPESFPTDTIQFRTLANANGNISPINIAQAISENADTGSVDGVEFSPIDFARIITWNAGQPSATDG